MRPPRTLLIASLAISSLAMPAAGHAACAAPDPAADPLGDPSKATSFFIGTAQPGPAASDGRLVSIATFVVDARLAGSRTGATEQLNTWMERSPDGTAAFMGPSEAGMTVRAGEQWMIVGRASDAGPLGAGICDPLTRRADLAHPRRVRVRAGKPVTPVPVDVLGRPATAAAAVKVPVGTTRIAGRYIETVRVIRKGKIRRGTRVSPTAWSVGTLRKGDRLAWLDDRGLWGGTAR